MSRTTILYGVLILGLGVLYALMVRPLMAGFEYDDGAYLLTAKALAHGRGYVLPYTEPLQALVKYPPLTSVVLAPLWWLPVEFPNNVVLFKGLNILLSMGFLAILAVYLTRFTTLPRWQGVCILLLIGLHPQFVHISTEILSEPLYLVLSMVVFLIAATGNDHKKEIMMMAALALLAYYARTVGILLVLALSAWLWVSNQKKPAALTLISGLLVCSGWAIWTHLQPDFTQTMPVVSEGSDRIWVLRTLNESYFTSIKTDLLYHYTWFDLYTTGLAALYGKWAMVLLPFIDLLPGKHLVELVAGFALLCLFLVLGISHYNKKSFSLAGMYVTLYLAVLPFWAYHDQYPRFLIVILPFLWIWLFQLANRVHEQWLPEKTPHILVPFSVLIISLCNILPVWFRLAVDPGNTITVQNKPPVWDDFLQTTNWLRHSGPADSMIWTSQMVIPYALYSNRKYFDAFLQLPPVYIEKLTDADIDGVKREESVLWRYQFIKHHVRYIVSNPVLLEGKVTRRMDETVEMLVKQYPDEFKIAYVSPHRLITVFEFTGQ